MEIGTHMSIWDCGLFVFDCSGLSEHDLERWQEVLQIIMIVDNLFVCQVSGDGGSGNGFGYV